MQLKLDLSKYKEKNSYEEQCNFYEGFKRNPFSGQYD